MIIRDNILDAITKINPDAKAMVEGHDIDDCNIIWLDGTTPIPIEDIKAQIPILKQEIADAASKKATDKASADAKLKALGLTDDEIEAFRS